MLAQSTLNADPTVIAAAGSWAVAWTKSRRETCLKDYLQSNDVPVYLPVVKRRRVYGRHVRESLIPLFNGYVFFDAERMPRRDVFASRHVADVLIPTEPERLRADLMNLAQALQAD